MSHRRPVLGRRLCGQPSLWAADERLRVLFGVGVQPGCGAVARRRARHRGDPGTPALVQCLRAGHSSALAQRPFVSLATNGLVRPLPVRSRVAPPAPQLPADGHDSESGIASRRRAAPLACPRRRSSGSPNVWPWPRAAGGVVSGRTQLPADGHDTTMLSEYRRRSRSTAPRHHGAPDAVARVRHEQSV